MQSPPGGYTDSYPPEYEVRWVDKSFCCCKIAFFPDGPFTVCGHWRVRLKVPIFVGLGFLVTFGSLLYDLTGVFPGLLWQSIADGVLILLALSVITSYMAVIIRGPGYVPYSWAKTRRKSYTWKEFMSQMVVYSEQAEAARAADRPPRSSFSINARRFVLRADHFCLWCQSWVGIRNHRYFLLMTAYVVIYAFAYLVARVFWVGHLADGHLNWFALIGGLSTFVTTVSGLIGLYHFSQAMRNLCNGVTAVELYHKRPLVRVGGSCVDNCEEICGRRALCCCWCWPFCICLEPYEDGFYSDLPPLSGDQDSMSHLFQTGEE
jgi:hypothetical protein